MAVAVASASHGSRFGRSSARPNLTFSRHVYAFPPAYGARGTVSVHAMDAHVGQELVAGGGPPGGGGKGGGLHKKVGESDDDDDGRQRVTALGTGVFMGMFLGFLRVRLLPTMFKCSAVCAVSERAVAKIRGEDPDPDRVKMRGVYGLTMKGVYYGCWFPFLDFLFRHLPHGRAALFKVAIDITIGTGIGSCVNLAGHALLQGKGLDGALGAIHARFWSVFSAGLGFWPLPTAVALTVLPRDWRIPFFLLCAFSYECVLAVLARQAELAEKRKALEGMNA